MTTPDIEGVPEIPVPESRKERFKRFFGPANDPLLVGTQVHDLGEFVGTARVADDMDTHGINMISYDDSTYRSIAVESGTWGAGKGFVVDSHSPLFTDECAVLSPPHKEELARVLTEAVEAARAEQPYCETVVGEDNGSVEVSTAAGQKVCVRPYSWAHDPDEEEQAEAAAQEAADKAEEEAYWAPREAFDNEDAYQEHVEERGFDTTQEYEEFLASAAAGEAAAVADDVEEPAADTRPAPAVFSIEQAEQLLSELDRLATSERYDAERSVQADADESQPADGVDGTDSQESDGLAQADVPATPVADAADDDTYE